jgi:LmbE family N-acetylglucosaminyl deacetylase
MASQRCALAMLDAPRGRHVLVVAAHPDDEVIGVGATLARLVAGGARITIVHATDGAPADAALRPTLRDCSRAEAARVRRAEVERALRAGGLEPSDVLAGSLGVGDQEAARTMRFLARSVMARLADDDVDVVVTHPYEGGHPDHDAVAFAVHAARELLARESGVVAPALAEMTSYHVEGGALATGRFLTGGAPAPTHTCTATHAGILDATARGTKHTMLAAFESQRDVLAPFGALAEPLRCAPLYDFTAPPHQGAPYYEQLPFGWTGARFRELARDARRELGLE